MENRTTQSERDEQAESPRQFSRRGWSQIGKRVVKEIKSDHVQIVAAGVAFYFFLALFPAIAAAVSIYGLLVDPAQAESQIQELSSMLPQQAHEAVTEIARHVAGQSGEALGWGVALSMLISLWSANKGSKALFEGLNIAYNEQEGRGFIKSTALTLRYTLVAVLAGLVAVALVVGFPAFVAALGLPGSLVLGLNFIRWPLAALVAVALFAYTYRVAPNRRRARWSWVSWGSALAVLLWLAGSALFSLYVSNFAKVGSAYGSFGAVVILMLWFFLTAFVILLGAEVNAEMEHQTAADTTVGPPRPMGERGAFYADRVAQRSSPPPDY